MTVLSQANKSTFIGNGLAGTPANPFTFTFNNGWGQGSPTQSLAQTYYSLLFTDAAGVQTAVTIGSGPNQAQLTLTPPVSGALWGMGGQVVYQPSGSPIPIGTTLTLLRRVPLVQATSLQNQSSYGQYAASAEQAMDLLEMQTQQEAELYGRAIVVNPADANEPLPLPPAAQRALLWLAFDGDGNPVAAAGPAGNVPISSAMQPVVAAATLALARTALGLGGLSVLGLGAGLQNDGSNNARVYFDTAAVATNQAIGAASHLTQYMATGPITFTLARANTLWDGFGFWVYALAGTITLTPNAADTIRGRASGQSFAIPEGSAAWVTTDGAGAGTWTIGWMPQAAPAFNCLLRLNAGVLQLIRFSGPSIFINGINENIPFNGVALAATGLTPSTLYYIYAYMNGVTMTLEASTTGPVRDDTYGHQIKSGDATRSLVGMARPVTGPAWASSVTQRFVRSYYNDPGLTLANNFTANRSTSSGVAGELNAEIRIEFLSWTDECVQVFGQGNSNNSIQSSLCYSAISFDGAGNPNVVSVQASLNGGGFGFSCSAFSNTLAQGYHYATLLGLVSNGTGTWNSTCRLQSVLKR